jgi:hypothetical protein
MKYSQPPNTALPGFGRSGGAGRDAAPGPASRGESQGVSAIVPRGHAAARAESPRDSAPPEASWERSRAGTAASSPGTPRDPEKRPRRQTAGPGGELKAKRAGSRHDQRPRRPWMDGRDAAGEELRSGRGALGRQRAASGGRRQAGRGRQQDDLGGPREDRGTRGAPGRAVACR